MGVFTRVAILKSRKFRRFILWCSAKRLLSLLILLVHPREANEPVPLCRREIAPENLRKSHFVPKALYYVGKKKLQFATLWHDQPSCSVKGRSLDAMMRAL